MFTKPQDDLDEEERNNLGAMNARMKRHHFSISYRGNKKFPYSTAQIALVLDYLDKTLKEEDYGTSTPTKQQGKSHMNALDMPILRGSEQPVQFTKTACGIAVDDAK